MDLNGFYKKAEILSFRFTIFSTLVHLFFLNFQGLSLKTEIKFELLNRELNCLAKFRAN